MGEIGAHDNQSRLRSSRTLVVLCRNCWCAAGLTVIFANLQLYVWYPAFTHTQRGTAAVKLPVKPVSHPLLRNYQFWTYLEVLDNTCSTFTILYVYPVFQEYVYPMFAGLSINKNYLIDLEDIPILQYRQPMCTQPHAYGQLYEVMRERRGIWKLPSWFTP